MKRAILQKTAWAVLFAAVTAAACAVCDFLLTDDIHSYSRVMLQELYAQAGEVDTLFLGSSHCYRAIDPDAVDERLGVNSFNAGTSQQMLDGSYYLLREAAAENDLDTVYLELFYTFCSQTDSKNVPLACYLITDHMKAVSPNRYRYLWEMGGLAAFADLLLPARHAIGEPGELPALWKAKLTDGYEPGNYAYVTYPEDGEEYRGDGFVYTYGVSNGDFSTILNVDAAKPITEFAQDYLDRIARYCEAEGIRLVLFAAPMPSAYIVDTENYQVFVDTMRDFAARNGTEYWDFSLYRDADALDLQPADFADAHHLNGAGAEKFVQAFCDVAQADSAGWKTEEFFFDTVQEKLLTAPDGTLQ